MGVALAEREEALSAIAALLDEAVAGRGGAMFVLAEAGLGKTALLDRAVELAAGRMAVGAGRADVAEAALPFGLVSQALEPLLGPGAAGLAEGTGYVFERAARRLHAVLHRLREAAAAPILIALDDAHWADPDSLTLLRLICRRVTGLPVAVVAAARLWPAETAQAAQELSAEGLARLQRLRPLTDQAAAALLRERAGDRADEGDIEAAVAACAGNPLLLGHVAAELAAGRPLPDRSGSAGSPEHAGSPDLAGSPEHAGSPDLAGSPEHAGAPGPASALSGSWASRLLLSRFAGVGAQAEAYLRAASVLGLRFRPEVAAEVAGLTPAQAAAAQQALAGAGLVADGGEGWAAFSHHLVRLAVYDQAAPQRAPLHELAFRVLLARGAPAAEAAGHAVAARLADPVALDVMIQAGREALQRGAPGTARRHLSAVVELAGDGVPAEVLLELAEALRMTGDNDGAGAVCDKLLARAELPAPVYLAALSELAQAEFRAGRIEQATARIDRAVRLAEDEPPELAAVVLTDQAHLCVLRLGPRAALPLAGRARSVAARAGGQIEAVADAVWAQCAYLAGDPAGLQAADQAARTAPGATPEVTEWADPRVLYAELAAWSERFELAEDLLAGIVAEATRRRHPMNLFEGRCLLAAVYRRTGRLAQALAVCDQLLEAAELMPFALPLAISEQALTLLELGRLDQAQACCQRVKDTTPARGGLGRVWTTARLGRAILAFRRGQMEEASRVFTQLERSARMVDLHEPCIYPWAWPAIGAHLACGREDRAASVIEWLEPRAGVLPSRWPRAVLAGGRAALAERRDDLQAADEGFARAACLHDRAMPLARAEALTDQGEFLLRHRQPARARPVLAEALRLAEDCKAGWHTGRARAGWRRAGGRSGTTRPGALTPQEQAVADLARAGLTNKEIAARLYLSVNTVETHLAHAYRKLGITRRWQLIAGRPEAGE